MAIMQFQNQVLVRFMWFAYSLHVELNVTNELQVKRLTICKLQDFSVKLWPGHVPLMSLESMWLTLLTGPRRFSSKRVLS